MSLDEGKRLFLELAGGDVVVALIERRAGDFVELVLLEDLPESESDIPRVIGLRSIGHGGMKTWRVDEVSLLSPGRIGVTVGGTPVVVDRRRHPRFAVKIAATVWRLGAEACSASYSATIVDLSEGGLRLVGAPSEIGHTVLVSLELHDEAVELVGRVLLAYPDQRGSRVAHVAFLEPAAESSDRLRGYLNGLRSDVDALTLA